MLKKTLLAVAVLTMMTFLGSSSAEAGSCRGPSGFYGGGFYGGGYRAPVYRSARYYGGPSYHYGRGPSYYRRAYYGGYPAYRHGYRNGVTFSFGF